jgi:(4S)-4-hydroxy-5-phosphonooxypentane-2,3-dione isomerase
MHIVVVHIHVKVESIAAFIQATLDNSGNSREETGVVRFDFLQQAEDPARFTLIEVYRDPAAQVSHRETSHYLKWRDAVADMMAESRQGIRYVNLDPTDAEWK